MAWTRRQILVRAHRTDNSVALTREWKTTWVNNTSRPDWYTSPGDLCSSLLFSSSRVLFISDDRVLCSCGLGFQALCQLVPFFDFIVVFSVECVCIKPFHFQKVGKGSNKMTACWVVSELITLLFSVRIRCFTRALFLCWTLAGRKAERKRP